MKSTQSLFENYQIKKKGKPTSERAFLIQELSDATGIEFPLLLRNTFHLKDAWGINILQMILNDTLAYSEDREWRRWKCAELVKASKGGQHKKLSTSNVAS